jgi:hypothetical protein
MKTPVQKSRSFLVATIWLSIVVLGRPAAAADSVEDLIAKGVELRRQGQHERALELFRRANAEDPSPRTVAQIGLAEQSLKRWIESENHLAAALQEGSNPWIRKNRAHLENALEAVRGHIGHLVVQGPPGATVYVRGESQGTLPLGPIRVGEGEVSLQVAAPSRQTFTRSVIIRPGEVATVAVQLEPATLNPERPNAEGGEPVPGPVTPSAGDRPRTPSPTTQADTSRAPVLRMVAWSSAAVGAVLLTGGLVETVVASNKLDQFQNTIAPDGSGRTCGVDRSQYGGGVCTTLHDDWKQARTLGIVGLVGGGVLAATSVALFVVSSGENDNHKVACAPALTSLGVTCAGRF